MSNFLLWAKLYAGHAQVAKICAWLSYKLLYYSYVVYVITKYRNSEKNIEVLYIWWISGGQDWLRLVCEM